MRILILLGTLLTLNVWAETTSLEGNLNEPSNEKIQKAIVALSKAMVTDGTSKSKNLAMARELIEKKSEMIVFQAAVYIRGKKQFIDSEFYDFLDFKGMCFKGSAAQAAKLINHALKLSFWEGDEEWVESASAKGKKVELTLMDGPNEYQFFEQINPCK